MSVRIPASSAIRFVTRPSRSAAVRFGNENPPPEPPTAPSKPGFFDRLKERAKGMGLWLVAGAAASAYPLYHGFQSYRLSQQLEVLETKPELELLRGLESRGQFLQQIIGEYPSLSPEAKATLAPTIEVLLKEYAQDVKHRTADHFITHNESAADQLVLDIMVTDPRFSKQSEAYTKKLFAHVADQLNKGESPWVVMGSYPTLLHQWIDEIAPEIGPIHASAARIRIDSVFQTGRNTVEKMDQLSDQVGQHNYRMVLGALGGMMLALLSINIMQSRMIHQYKNR